MPFMCDILSKKYHVVINETFRHKLFDERSCESLTIDETYLSFFVTRNGLERFYFDLTSPNELRTYQSQSLEGLGCVHQQITIVHWSSIAPLLLVNSSIFNCGCDKETGRLERLRCGYDLE